MANEQEAGSIVIALTAQAEGVEKGFSKAEQAMTGFGKKTEQVAQQTKTSGERITTTFDAMDRRAIRMAARFAMLTNRMVGLSFALGQLQQVGGRALGKFQAQLDTGAAAIAGFASGVAAFPNAFGIGIGALLGLGNAFRTVSNAIEEADKRSADMAKRLAENLRKVNAALAGREFDELLAPGIPGLLQLQKQDQVDRIKNAVGNRRTAVTERGVIDQQRIAQEAELNRLLEERRLIDQRIEAGGSVTRQRIEKLDAQIAGLEKTMKKGADRALELDKHIQGFEETIQGAATEVQNLDAALKDVEGWNAFNEQLGEFDTKAEEIEKAIENKLIDPLEAFNQRAKLAEERLKFLLASPKFANFDQLRKAKGEFDAANDPLAAALALDDSTRPEQDRAAQKALADKAADALSKNQDEFHAAFTEPFTEAIGVAMADGIMRGEKPMETLANMGRNLFANFLNDSIKNFQTGMKDALSAIAGEGGGILGSALTGIFGVLGGIFANRKSKSSESFTGVDSRIESSQAVRGIVAGPASVAIASVGEDISRAMEPVREVLLAQLSVQIKIEKNTRGAAGAGSVGAASFVAVPTA